MAVDLPAPRTEVLERPPHALPPRIAPRRRHARRHPGCRLAVQLVSGRFEVPAAQIVARRRGSRRAARARQAAMYLAHVALGLPVLAVGKAFRRDHTTVSYACHRVEDRRDDPAFDAALADLELAARIALASDLPMERA